MNNHGKQYVYFLYLFLSIHLRRYFVSFDDRLIFENVWVVFNYNEKDFVSVRSVGEIESPLSSTFYLSLKMSFMIFKCTVVCSGISWKGSFRTCLIIEESKEEKGSRQNRR